MVLIRILLVIIVFLCSVSYASTPNLISVNAQDNEVSKAPNPFSLPDKWWLYVDINNEKSTERAGNIKETINKHIELANPELQKELNGLVQQINASLDGLSSSKLAIIEELPTIDSNKDAYSIAELELLLASYHQHKSKEVQLSTVLRDEEEIAKKAEQIANETRDAYLKIDENTERKLKLGLTIMANRLSWYLWTAQSPNRISKIKTLSSQIELILQEIELASGRLLVDEKDLNKLELKIDRQEKILERLRSITQQNKDQYTGIMSLDFMSRLEERLLAQNIIALDISVKQAEIDLAILGTLKSLVLAGNQNQIIENYNPVVQYRDSNIVLSKLDSLIEEWRKNTSAESFSVQELLTSGYVTEDNKAAQKLIDQRISSIKESLENITKLEQSAFDLKLLNELLEERLEKTEGWLFSLKTIFADIHEHTGSKIWEILNIRLIDLGETHVTSWSLIQSLIILLVTFFIAKLVQRFLLKINTNSEDKIPPAIYTLARLIFYLIIVFGVFIAFSSIGVNFTNLAIVAGALSVGIGFGLQSIVNNFVSGIIILFEQNIKVGDFVELDSGLRGTVRDINVRSTIVNTLDNLDIIVPNSDLVTAKVTNYTLNEPIVRVHIPFGVAYGSDKELVKRATLEAARNVDITYNDGAKRQPQVWLVGFGDSSLDFELVTWLNPKGGKAAPGSWRALYTWEIESALNKYGIVIPFPQRDLHIKSGLVSENTWTDKPESI